jgi:hypothetical protein
MVPFENENGKGCKHHAWKSRGTQQYALSAFVV